MQSGNNASRSFGSLMGLHGPEHHDGGADFSLRMWDGIPVRSRELRNSTGYCTASPSFMALSTDLYSISSPGNSFRPIKLGSCILRKLCNLIGHGQHNRKV